MNTDIKTLIIETFLEIANAIESGRFCERLKIGLTTLGSELGVEEVIKGGVAASKTGLFDVVLIGPKCDTDLEVIEANDERETHQVMNKLLDESYLKACVTMHYPFPIGVATVGRVITPAKGKELILATTTGTSDTNRTIAMVKNAIYGIITAKALGISNPTVGILNVENAPSVERFLHKLHENGYKINFGESIRHDKGFLMRGNDLINPNCDVMVTDTLTGNILMKLFSSYNTGGNYEVLGYGYGPGIGFDQDRIINIISRASGAPVIKNALIYAYEVIKGNIKGIIKAEYDKLQKANLDALIEELKQNTNTNTSTTTKVRPAKETVSEEILGVEIFELDNAVNILMDNGIYAESGMGCTGPVVLVSPNHKEKAIGILKMHKYL